jgi:hypothetical protein
LLSYKHTWLAMDTGMAQESPSVEMAVSDEYGDADDDSNRHRCNRRMCPWCILGVERQADVTAAAHAWQLEHESFTLGDINPWKYWIASCAWNWIWTMHCVQVQPPARTLADQGIWGVTTPDTEASLPPPPPPQSLLPSMEASAAAARRLVRQAESAGSASAISSSSPWRDRHGGIAAIPVGAVGGQPCVVEYWGGKATGWTPYDATVQGILQAARSTGNLRVEVSSGGRDYIICMETMQQWRKPWHNNYNVRQIRFNTGATERVL